MEPMLEPASPRGDHEMPATFSMRLWKADWSKQFPIVSTNGSVVCRHVSFERVKSFLLSQPDPDYSSKSIFYEAFADAFGFYDAQDPSKLVGAGIANPSDPTTYYIRYCYISEAYRKSGIFSAWIRALTLTMQSCPAVQRIEVEITPELPHMPGIYSKLGYRFTGMTFSDRWGGIIRMTAHLSSQQQGRFIARFCPSIAPQAQITQGGAQ